MTQLEGKLVEIWSHRCDTREIFRVIEERPAIGFVKVALDRHADGSGGFWIEVESVRAVER